MLRKLQLFSRERSVIVPYLLWHRTSVNMIISEGWSHLVTFMTSQCLFVCLFDWGLLSCSRFFSLIWRRHHYRWRAAKIDLCSTFMSTEQWGFFSVPHLLWHRTSVYNGHLWGHLTHTFSSAKRLAVEPFLPSHPKTTQLWDSTHIYFLCKFL